MKILVVGPYPPPYSGPETSIKLLLESPLKNLANIRLINTNFRKDMASKGRMDFQAVCALLHIFFLLAWECIRFRPNIVYYYVTATRNGWLFKDIWIILISKLFLRKTVIHMRAGHFKYEFKKMNRLSQWLIRYVCGKCSMAFVQAACLRDQFEGIISEEKIHYIYNMIDINKYHNPCPNSYEKGRFFYMGHLSAAKGYCDLLSVIPRIVEEYPWCKFVFAGYRLEAERNVFQEQTSGRSIDSEPPEEAYAKYIQGRCEENYQYIGPIDENQKLEEFQKCMAFVLPSYSEGFSMAVLEALSYSKPIVCTPVGALGEVVKDRVNGLIVDAGDREALYLALKRMICDSELRESMIAWNHKYTVQNFSQEIVSGKIYEVFLHLLSSCR